jgi:ABC-2 type transport system ATP-binding protein
VVARLSGGQRSRASLAVALLGSPDLLVLDEPTVGLDPVLREELWSTFHGLADAGAAVLVSSHVMDEAERCDRLLLMRDGVIIADGSPTAIKEKAGVDDIEQAFLTIVRGEAAA